MNKPSLEELFKTVERILVLANKMDEVYDPKNKEGHLKLAIAAGLCDMYEKGYMDGIKNLRVIPIFKSPLIYLGDTKMGCHRQNY